ncbi:MAG TPA: Ig-like domain-containing protein [Thermoanaerobaculia bacterium]|nr:Ig-like domain-containing protein [Thermoanaerobaculia bacterium]
MQSLAVRVLLSFVLVILGPLAFAHDVTLTGTQNFSALDGSSSDHDGAVNGVFTVNDGNLVVNGVVNCNDDGATSNSACAMAFVVSGNMTLNTGGALYAENRTGGGSGGAITLTVGGNLALNGNAIVSTSSKSSSGATGGAITANVGGTVSVAAGTTIDSGAANARGGAIAIVAGNVVSIDGNVLSGPSRTILATRLTDVALDGGTANQIGGSITISSSTFVEPALLVGTNANIITQGDGNGAGPITLDACGIQIRGLVAALSRGDSAARVAIRSGKDVLIDGRDLGASGTRMGRVRADAPSGTALNKGVDVFAAETIDIFGPGGSLFVVSSQPGIHDSKSYGGTIRVISLGDVVNGSGNLIQNGHTASGDSGGVVSISAKGNVNLNTAVIKAVGDFSTNNSNRGGGSIAVRSYSGDVIWTNGTGEVRPVGSTSGLVPADQGSIVLTACGTVNTTGSSFPVMATATSMFPETHTGVCSPGAPSLPVGTPPLVTCNTPPVANDASATTNEDTTVTITLSGTDADGDSLTFTIVSGPAHGSLGAINPTGPTSATVDYAPNLNYNGPDSFVYRANDGNGGTDDATVTITVNPVNDPPSFLIGPTDIVLEDSGPRTYTNWVTAISAGPSDESGQTVTFTVTNSNNALFSVQPAVASNGTLTYTPAPNAYGTATITVVAHDNGGTANGGNDTSGSQTSNINVTAVNDEPSFVKGANQTVNEDAGPQTVSGWATAISAGPNEPSQTVSFVTSNNNNALFSVQPSVAPNGTLTYTPAANANGSATVTIYLTDNGGTANGGDDTSPSDTFTITVNAVNDEPSFTSGGNVTVDEDSGAYNAAWATAISAGPANESSQTVTFNVSNNNNALFSVQPAVDSNGVLTFTLAANANGSATVTIYAQDNGGTANGGDDTSPSQTFTISVNAVNDEPSFTPGADQSSFEDAGPQTVPGWATGISAGPANESGQTVSFVASNDNNALFSSQPAIASNGTLTYTAAPNANGSATVTVYAQDNGGTANGGDDTSASYTFTITVVAVNDAPSFNSGGNVTVNEDSGAYLQPWATGISAGPADENGQSLTFNIVSNSNPSLFSAGPSISSTGVLSFTPAANAFGSATLVINLQDNGGTANGGADTSGNATFTITVNAVNDAPSFTPGGDVTVNEDSGPYLAPWATGISAGPNEGGQTVSFNVSNNNNALFLVQPSISSTGVLTFTSAPNAYGSALVTVSLQDNGGTANGGVDTSAPVQFTITVNAVNDAPTAATDAWDTLGNTELRVDFAGGLTPKITDTTPSGNGVRDNDSDPEGDPFVVTKIVGCGDVSAPFDCTLGDGSKVSMLANGSFSFTPGPGVTSSSFQYEVTDIPAAGLPATSTGTVNITIYDMIWYVNGSAAPGGNGTSIAPFNDFSSLDGAGGAGDVDSPNETIFVHDSNVIGGIELEANQNLWGEGVGLSTSQNLNGNGTSQVLVSPGTRARIFGGSGNAVSVSGVSGVDIAGLDLNSTGANGIDVTSNPFGSAADATIHDNVVTGAALQGIEVNAGSVSGTTVAINNTSITSAGNGLDVGSVGPAVISYSNGTILSTGGSGIFMLGGGNLTVSGLSNVTIDGNTAGDGVHIDTATFDSVPGGAFNLVSGGSLSVGTSGNPVGGAGVVLTNVSGDLSFSNASVSGATDGFSATGSGLYTGSAGMRLAIGAGSLRASAGAGLSVTNTTIAASGLNLTSIHASGGTNGILLNNTGASGSLTVSGTGSADSGGIIQTMSGDGVRLTSTLSPSFSWMRIQNTGANGVRGTDVVNFTFANGTVTSSGDAVGESNISFAENITGSNVSGNVSVTNSTLTNAFDSGLRIRNGSGTLANVTVTGNTFTSTTSTATSKGSAIHIELTGSAATVASITKATLANNTISNFPSGAGIKVLGGNATAGGPAATVGASAANAIAITNNQISGLSTAVRLGTNAIETAVSGIGSGNFNISNNGTVANPLRNMTGAGITMSVFGNANVTGTISNNVIVANNALGSSGIAAGADQTFGFTDSPNINVTISGNNVSNTSGNGILAGVRNTNGIGSFKITNNTVGAPTASVRPGIRVDSGTAAGGNASLCLELTGNTTGGSGGSAGIGLRKQGTNPALNAFGIVGMSATSSPGVEQYVDGLNSSVPSPFGDGDGVVLLSATSGFTSCSLP